MGNIHVLHVEDDPRVRELVASYLERADDVTVEGVTDGDGALAAIDDGADCVVSDPVTTAAATLEAIRSHAPRLPVVFYTGADRDTVLAAAADATVDVSEDTDETDRRATDGGGADGDTVTREQTDDDAERDDTGPTGYVRKGDPDGLRALEARIRDVTAAYEIAGDGEYGAVVESVGVPVYVLDADRRIAAVNEAFTDLTGYEETALVGREPSVVMTPAAVAEQDRQLRSVVADETRDDPLVEVDVQTAGGRTITCENHVGVLPTDGPFRGSVGVLRNVRHRRRRERELRRERDRFRTLFESVPVAAVQTAFDGDRPIVVTVNREFERIFGYEASGVVGENLDALLAPEGAEASVRETTRELRETGRVSRIARRRTADGPRTFRIDVVLRNPDDDRPEGYATYLDVSDVEAVQSQERALIERMADGLFALDENWRITTFNERGYELLRDAAPDDPSREVLRGRSLWDAVPDVVGTTFEENYRAAMTTQEPTSFEAYYDPLDRWFEIRAYPSRDGLSVHFQNVTSDRQRREEIARREEILREVYEVASDTALSFEEQVERLLAVGADVLDAEYGSLSRTENGEYVLEVTRGPSDAFSERGRMPLSETVCERVTTTEQTLSYSDLRREAPELTDRELADGRDVSCYVGTPVTVNGEVYGVFCFYASDARSRFSEWEVTLVDLMGRLVGYALQTRTAREALERQNERLEELASVLSHDLRNPLSVAQGNLELARSDGDEGYFRKTQAALDRIDELITDLLTLARDEGTEEFSDVSLAGIAEESWETVSTAAASLVAEGDAVIRADRVRLKRIFENCYRNALTYAGESPTVRVGVTEEGFYVADDGPGIPLEERERVFQSGFSTGENGHGLGLSIVAETADAHGWTVEASESESGGARFDFRGVSFVDT